MPIHNKNSLFLSLAGGALMIIAGVSGAIGVIGELSEVLQYFYGLEFFITFESFMQGLAMWAGLGGFVVVIGGLILTTEKVRFGRMIILAGVTVGVVGLLMTLVQMASTGVFVMGMFEQMQQSIGWIGAIMAYVGRIVAEQKPILDRE